MHPQGGKVENNGTLRVHGIWKAKGELTLSNNPKYAKLRGDLTILESANGQRSEQNVRM